MNMTKWACMMMSSSVLLQVVVTVRDSIEYAKLSRELSSMT